ncbi:MAG: 50S ribosomal protein L24 [Parcubacteria group bacterium]|nr:50S ribosomal protein L24 [Parcubacteria group bacterium]
MYIKKGDSVIIRSGKDKGKKGAVLRVLRREEMVVVEGVNMKKKHQRPRRSGQKGQILDIAAPLHVSNVALLDPKTGAATRVGFRAESGKKVRFAKRSGAAL